MRMKLIQPLVTFAFLCAASAGPLHAQQANRTAAPAPQLKMTVSGYSDGGDIPVKYTCAAKADMVSPMIEWSDAPKDTASFALILHDVDAQPRKGITDVTHWILWNIPGTATELPGDLKPSDAPLTDGVVQGKNIRGADGYAGPCAPPGKPHHYMFELYALDTKLDLTPGASRDELLKAMDGHIIGKSVYVGLFHQ